MIASIASSTCPTSTSTSNFATVCHFSLGYLVTYPNNSSISWSVITNDELVRLWSDFLNRSMSSPTKFSGFNFATQASLLQSRVRINVANFSKLSGKNCLVGTPLIALRRGANSNRLLCFRSSFSFKSLVSSAYKRIPIRSKAEWNSFSFSSPKLSLSSDLKISLNVMRSFFCSQVLTEKITSATFWGPLRSP